MASIIAPAIFTGMSDDEIKALSEYADCIGVAFQIRDDILDVEGTSESWANRQEAMQRIKKLLMYHYMDWMKRKECSGM